MKIFDEKLRPDKDYRELFTVEVDEIKCTDTIVGMKNNGELLYIKEKLASSGNSYWMDRIFYSIDKDELHRYLEMAKKNGEIEKAIRNGKTTAEELDKLEEA